MNDVGAMAAQHAGHRGDGAQVGEGIYATPFERQRLKGEAGGADLVAAVGDVGGDHNVPAGVAAGPRQNGAVDRKYQSSLMK